jgi:hypothetical protein
MWACIMKRSVVFDLHIPKTVRIDSINITSIPLDDSWIVSIRENHATIGEMPLGVARRKYT